MNTDLINRWAYLFQKLSMGNTPISFDQGTKFINRTYQVNLKNLIIPEPVVGQGREKYFQELNQRKSSALKKLENYVNVHSPQAKLISSSTSPLSSPPFSTSASPIKSAETTEQDNDQSVTSTPIESPIVTPISSPTISRSSSPSPSTEPNSPITSRPGSPDKLSIAAKASKALPPLPIDPFGPLLPAINDGTPRTPKKTIDFSSPRPSAEEIHLSDVSLQFS